ncbi:MAG: TlpA family protein disulfide reductase [Mucilaginibacter sp.]|nr:TlpA family protein disulfide reductase [Mucilaginibacter sp.]
MSLTLLKPTNAQVTTSKIHYLTDTTLNFDGLISQFKNKVIYVDAWATWCVPCRQELQRKKDVQAFANFAAKNDIVILYICCDYNGSKWKQYIKANNLAGYHFLINKAVHDDFHTTLSQVQMRSKVMKRSFYMPRHIIIDKNGVIADSNATQQGNPKVYATLKKLLAKAG